MTPIKKCYLYRLMPRVAEGKLLTVLSCSYSHVTDVRQCTLYPGSAFDSKQRKIIRFKALLYNIASLKKSELHGHIHVHAISVFDKV